MENLSLEDKKRAMACDEYKSSKRIIKSCSEYKDYEVGTAVYIKDGPTKEGQKTRYVGAGYEGKEPPHKFIIIAKDEGFLFAKRILATGKPGVEITCLTIRYPSDYYELVVDSDYLDAMLLDTMDNYDPTSAAKELAKKKNKASRLNNKERVWFESPTEAYNYLKILNKGDIFWGAETSFGSEITKYIIDEVQIYNLDPNAKARHQSWSRYDSNDPHASHATFGFSVGVCVKLAVVESECRWSRPKSIYFYNITNADQFRQSTQIIYKSKPSKPEDIV